MATLQQQEGRPRAQSALSGESIRSSKTHKSSGSKDKIDLTESPKDKRRLQSKADPTKAIQEAQPSMLALEASELDALSTIQHRDHTGSVIIDPDRSNPTRPRFERPLETIRRFEEAAERTRRNNSTAPAKQDTEDSTIGGYGSRRNSSFGVLNGGPPPSRGNPDGGYYGSRNGYASRPDSFVDNYAGPNQQGRLRYSRGQSEPMLYGGRSHHVYPTHGPQPSYDTVTSGEQAWGTSTDPSSINSSNDRIHDVQKQAQTGIPEDRVPTETYGFNGFGPQPQLDTFQGVPGNGQPRSGQAQQPGAPAVNGSYPNESGPHYGNSSGQANGYPANSYNNYSRGGFNGAQSSMMPPQVPQKPNNPRVPIKLDAPAGTSNSTGSPLERAQSKVSNSPKRKSWFKRRFSKGD